MQRIYKDQARFLIPAYATVEDQRKYYLKMEAYSSQLITCGMNRNKTHCFIIKEIQRKIRDDIWTKVKMELKLANRKDEWFKLDPGGAKIAFSQALIEAFQETEDRQNEAGDTAVPVYMTATSSQEAKKPRMIGPSGPQPHTGDGQEEDACESWEAYVASQRPERKQAGPKPRMVAFPPCVMCGDEEHAAVRCEIRDKNTRFKLFRQKNMCFNCGNKGCSAVTCPHPMQCRTCKNTDRNKHCSLLCVIEELNPKQPKQFKDRSDRPKAPETPQVRHKSAIPSKYPRKEIPKGDKLTGFQKGTPASRAAVHAAVEEVSSESEPEPTQHKEEDEPAQGQTSKELLDPEMLAAQIFHLQELQRQALEPKKDD
jgi:hypothetical protein